MRTPTADRSPIASRLVGSYDEQCVVLYAETIPLLVIDRNGE